MGNSSSSSRNHQEDTVDYGYLAPQGVYTTARDHNQAIVSQLICERKLAPFYRPLEEYSDTWDDDQILAARKEFTDPDATSEQPTVRTDTSYKTIQSKRSSLTKDSPKPEASVYRGAVECPICFLVRQLSLPPLVSHSDSITLSTILPTLIIHAAAIKQYVQNALSRSSARSPRPPISYLNPPLALIAWRIILVLYTHLLCGVPVSEVKQ